jgi:hypothetical protein
MRTDKALSRLPLLLALLALTTAVSTAVAIWIWIPSTTAAQSNIETTASVTPDPPVPTSSSVPSDRQSTAAERSGKRFANDAEALKAASTALTDYLRVYDLITSDGGADAGRIAGFVTPEYLTLALDEFAMYSALGMRSSGPTAFDTLVLENVMDLSDGGALVSVSYCLDTSEQSTINGSLEISGGVPAFRRHFIVDFLVPADPDQRPLVDYTVFASDSPLCPSSPAAAN